MSKSTVSNVTTLSREEEAFQALHKLNSGIADIGDLCQFVIDNGPLGNADFPRGIAAAISMIHLRAVGLSRVLGEVL